MPRFVQRSDTDLPPNSKFKVFSVWVEKTPTKPAYWLGDEFGVDFEDAARKIFIGSVVSNLEMTESGYTYEGRKLHPAPELAGYIWEGGFTTREAYRKHQSTIWR